MTSEKKEQRWGRIPIRFADVPDETDPEENSLSSREAGEALDSDAYAADPDLAADEEAIATNPVSEGERNPPEAATSETAGPVFAELLATRAELKRLEAEAVDMRDKAARRQADFENFRKRTERERSETYSRAAADLVIKLLPVLDNLGRALDTEASVEATESDEFRHFLSGVDLIYKQLGGVLETMGVKTVPSVGQKFDPHLHEAVTTEATDEHEPETVLQEIVRGYKLGDKLLRPALVKVAVKK